MFCCVVVCCVVLCCVLNQVGCKRELVMKFVGTYLHGCHVLAIDGNTHNYPPLPLTDLDLLANTAHIYQHTSIAFTPTYTLSINTFLLVICLVIYLHLVRQQREHEVGSSLIG